MTGDAAVTTTKAVVLEHYSKTTTNNNNNILKAKDIVTGKIALTDLAEPYLFIYDDNYDISVNNNEEDHLAKAVNIIIANKMGYRIVTPCYMGIISDRVVCMVK